MIIGTVRAEEARVFSDHAGLHYVGAKSPIEVFWDDADTSEWDNTCHRNYDAAGEPVKPGWYWQYTDMSMGEPVGPFSTSHRALSDAHDKHEDQDDD